MNQEDEGCYWILEEEQPPPDNWAVPVIMTTVVILALYFTIEGIEKSKRK